MSIFRHRANSQATRAGLRSALPPPRRPRRGFHPPQEVCSSHAGNPCPNGSERAVCSAPRPAHRAHPPRVSVVRRRLRIGGELRLQHQRRLLGGERRRDPRHRHRQHRNHRHRLPAGFRRHPHAGDRRPEDAPSERGAAARLRPHLRRRRRLHLPQVGGNGRHRRHPRSEHQPMPKATPASSTPSPTLRRRRSRSMSTSAGSSAVGPTTPAPTTRARWSPPRAATPASGPTTPGSRSSTGEPSVRGPAGVVLGTPGVRQPDQDQQLPRAPVHQRTRQRWRRRQPLRLHQPPDAGTGRNHVPGPLRRDRSLRNAKQRLPGERSPAAGSQLAAVEAEAEALADHPRT